MLLQYSTISSKYPICNPVDKLVVLHRGGDATWLLMFTGFSECKWRGTLCRSEVVAAVANCKPIINVDTVSICILLLVGLS